MNRLTRIEWLYLYDRLERQTVFGTRTVRMLLHEINLLWEELDKLRTSERPNTQ